MGHGNGVIVRFDFSWIWTQALPFTHEVTTLTVGPLRRGSFTAVFLNPFRVWTPQNFVKYFRTTWPIEKTPTNYR